MPNDSHFTTSDGLRLRVRREGTGPPVLLLHGFPDTGALWDETAARLRQAGYRTLVPDQRGFGESDAPAGSRHYTLARIVADLTELLAAACPGERVRVVGHDWGAVVAWCLAFAQPERVQAQVVMSVGHPREYARAGLEQKRKGLYTIAWQLRGLAEWHLSRDDYRGLRRWRQHVAGTEESLRWIARPGRLTAGLNWYRANLRRVLFGRWPACTVPTLGIWSDQDAFLAEDQMQRSSRQMRAPWRYVRIDGAGHWLPLERPDEMASLTLEWFRQHAAA